MGSPLKKPHCYRQPASSQTQIPLSERQISLPPPLFSNLPHRLLHLRGSDIYLILSDGVDYPLQLYRTGSKKPTKPYKKLSLYYSFSFFYCKYLHHEEEYFPVL